MSARATAMESEPVGKSAAATPTIEATARTAIAVCRGRALPTISPYAAWPTTSHDICAVNPIAAAAEIAHRHRHGALFASSGRPNASRQNQHDTGATNNAIAAGDIWWSSANSNGLVAVNTAARPALHQPEKANAAKNTVT